MSSTLEPATLAALTESYEILGELAGRDGEAGETKTLLAVRRGDMASVIITIARTPKDDEGNALSLLAADTNLLATLQHRNLLPIVEGRWVGNDAFAVVSERTNAPTLGELLDRDKLPFARIAAILQEVNGLLEWARGQKIVHRAVTPETLLIEQGSDRVLASFAISPIPFGRTSPLGVDARTIGNLAQAMLARHEDLAVRVVEQTDVLLKLSHNTENVPDIPAYIASIAMAEALKLGEIEYDRSRHAIEEQQRIAQEELEAERAKHTTALAEQTKAFDKKREEFERELAKERQELAKQREALTQERAAHAKDRAELDRERTAHDSDKKMLEQERAQHEKDRKDFESQAIALQGRAKLYEATQELPIPVADSAAFTEVVESGEPPERVESARPTKPAEVSRPPQPVARPPQPVARPTQPVARPTQPVARTTKPVARPKREPMSAGSRASLNFALVAGALLVIATASTLAISSGRGKSTPVSAAATAASPVTAATPKRVVDSVSGGVGPAFLSSVPLPSSVPDSVMIAAAQADSAMMRQIRRERAARRAAAIAWRDSIANAAFVPRPPTAADSAAGMRPSVPTDSAAKRDSVPKRDSARVDSVAKRDTTRLR